MVRPWLHARWSWLLAGAGWMRSRPVSVGELPISTSGEAGGTTASLDLRGSHSPLSVTCPGTVEDAATLRRPGVPNQKSMASARTHRPKHGQLDDLVGCGDDDVRDSLQLVQEGVPDHGNRADHRRDEPLDAMDEHLVNERHEDRRKQAQA